MTRKFQFARFKSVIFLFLILSTVLMLSGCDTISKLLTPIATGPVCTPESPLLNVYRMTPQPWVNLIFEYAFPSIPTAEPPATPFPPPPQSEQQILAARYAALDQLTKETTHWSDAKTITLEDASQIRITVTYVSPELLQAVVLNQALKDRFFTAGFHDQLQSALDTVAKRDELLFLLTVTTINTNSNPAHHTVRIPIKEMVLHNTENVTIISNHSDYNLEQVIDTLSEPVFGYLGYPLSVVTAEKCEWALDPTYNTNIVVTVPFLEVDGAARNPAHFWTIPYAPLITTTIPSGAPNFSMPLDYDPNLMTPLSVPPNDINLPTYWRDFARFIWGQITLGKY